MASTTGFRTVFLTKPWRPLPRNRASPSVSFFSSRNPQIPHLGCACKLFKPRNRRTHHLNYSDNETPSSSPDDSETNPPQEAVLKAISEVSKTEGRVGQTTNVVIGGTVHDDSTNEWLVLDKKVNSYPSERVFTAIGTGGDDFVQAMVVAVESVIQQSIPEGQVKQKVSSGGKYVSVNIGPIQVVCSEQVQAVYNAMRQDDRMKYFL
nr:Fibrous sheath-interacting protein [Ipomoea batatas]GME17304.1 Fibrous sheath-interacting protein [Ipomoea batatas]